MKALKYVAYAAGGIIVLLVIAAIGVALVVDGAFVKSRLEQAMKEKNRGLKIEGVPKLRLFPVAGLALGKTSLSEAGSDRVFVAFDSAEVALRVMPLFSGEVAVETLKLAGLNATVVRRKDGSMNFSDLAGKPGEDKKDKREEPPVLRLAEIGIDKAQVVYRDEVSGQELTVADFNLKTGRLDGESPGEVALSARVSGKRPVIDLRAQASGALRFNLSRGEFAFDKFVAQVKGQLDRDQLAAEFSAPKVEVTRAQASGSEVKGTLQLKGPQRNVDARLNIASIQGKAGALDIPKLALDFSGTASGVAAKAQLQAAIKANLPKQDLTADLSGRLDDAPFKGRVGLTNFVPLAANFDLDFERLNVDRYLPPDSKSKDEKVDLAVLKGYDVKGKLAVGALTAQRVKLENFKAEVKLAGGKLEVAPHSANLYGGTLAGTVTADANGNRVSVKEELKNVSVGPLLRDAMQKDLLEGRGNVTLDVHSAGGTETALKKALAGSARLDIKDGAIKGINLADSARNLKSMVGGKSAKPDASQKTDFSEMSASFKIDKGVARNDDLKAASPFIRLGGAGNIDVGNSTLDYLAKATLAATSKGQGGRDAKDLTGITIPVKLSGPLDNPNWNVDYSGLLGSAGGALGGLGETAKKGASGIGDAVRGIFKR
jgi:AsmA protein